VSQLGETVVRYYEPILKSKFDDYPKRAKDLDHILTIMDRYEDLDEFLADMALEPPTTSDGNTLAAQDSTEDRLVLSTIHSAKGLEWHTVFVIWVLDGRFPSVQSMGNPEDLEEELRLMYVAATRAKENLLFTYPGHSYDRATGMVLNRPSRFIDGIPDDILQKNSLLGWRL
jgi:DNA helicase-2/ATP-dependent DNA helicase PcrA